MCSKVYQQFFVRNPEDTLLCTVQYLTAPESPVPSIDDVGITFDWVGGVPGRRNTGGSGCSPHAAVKLDLTGVSPGELNLDLVS